MAAQFTVNESHNFTAEDLVLQIFKLAYLYSKEVGLGFLQAVSHLPPDEQLKHSFLQKRNDGCEINADYVFGRMMKTNIVAKNGVVTVYPEVPNWEYQSWRQKFACSEDLILHAVQTLEETNNLKILSGLSVK